MITAMSAYRYKDTNTYMHIEIRRHTFIYASIEFAAERRQVAVV